MAIPWDVILGGAMIFVMRVCDVTIGTIRLILVTRGRKYHAAMLGFFEVLIFLIAISEVVRNANNVANILGYCAGFAVGNIVGVTLEERIALGYSLVRVFTHQKGEEVADALRTADFGATETFGQGRDGVVSIVETAVHRRDLPKVQKLITQIDNKAFIVVDEARGIFRGYLRKGK